MHSLHSETVICSWPIVAIDLAVCIFVVSLALDSNLDLANWHTDGSPTHNDAKHLPMPLLEESVVVARRALTPYKWFVTILDHVIVQQPIRNRTVRTPRAELNRGKV